MLDRASLGSSQGCSNRRESGLMISRDDAKAIAARAYRPQVAEICRLGSSSVGTPGLIAPSSKQRRKNVAFCRSSAEFLF